MKKMRVLVTFLSALAVLTALAGRSNAVNLLVNGDLDNKVPPGAAGTPPTGWTLDEFKTFSGPTTDLITTEGFIAIGPDTSPGDLGGFVKAFNGNGTTGDLATLHMYQDVPAVAGTSYVFSGWIGAGVNYSGLVPNTPTQTLLTLEFRNAANTVVGSATKDVQAAGLTSGPCCAFGAQLFSVTGTAPAGATSVRAIFAANNMFLTQNPDQAAFIDDFNLSVAVPEPASIALGMLGLVGMIGVARRRS
jgi:hypothetical protein